MRISKFTLGIGAAGLLAALLIAPASAAPVLSNTAAVKSASDVQPTQVRWRGGAIAAGVGAGLVAGAVIASQPRYGYDSRYYDSGYNYPQSYGYGYGYPQTQENHSFYQGRVDTFKEGAY
jgi:hypothetical protein